MSRAKQQSTTIELPQSYTDLKFQDIRVEHVPASSRAPTPVILLTLYRPGKHNAFTDTMAIELEQAFAMFSVDDRVRCIVVTGHGRMFCAGADLQVGFRVEDHETELEHRDGGGRVAIAIHQCTKPTIAAIQGHAVGVGITMTLPMAIRVAWREAKIGFVFARRGLVMEACSSFFLPRLLGYARAVHLVTTGATYKADHRLAEGLFGELMDKPEDVLPRALDIAREVAHNTSTVSTYLMRELMWRGPTTAEGTHLLDSRVLHGLRKTDDNTEGVKSFLEKRPVRFVGSMAKGTVAAYPWFALLDTSNRAKAVAATTPSKL